jgi:hypothetical protein
MSKTIVVTEEQILTQFQEFFMSIDADDLAKMVGDWFGGECYFFGGKYNFYPDENYMGAFGDIEDE